MNKVKIFFSSIMTQDANVEKIQYKVDGVLDNEKDYQKLIFEEPIETGQDIIKNEIFFNEDEVIMMREGNVYHEMSFLRKKTSSGFYELQGLQLKLDIVLLEFVVANGFIKLVYDLYIDDDEGGHFDIEIKFGSEIYE
jgi:uncharacterized beta-barrel protein YwiB (DUF1934 family)